MSKEKQNAIAKKETTAVAVPDVKSKFIKEFTVT